MAFCSRRSADTLAEAVALEGSGLNRYQPDFVTGGKLELGLARSSEITSAFPILARLALAFSTSRARPTTAAAAFERSRVVSRPIPNGTISLLTPRLERLVVPFSGEIRVAA